MNRKTEIRNKIITAIIIIVAVVGVMYFLNIISYISNSNSSSGKYKQKDALEKAFDKTLKGEELSPTEQRELDSYKQWEWKQYDKQYYK